MSIFSKTTAKAVPLTAQLTATGDALRTRADTAAAAAESYHQLAEDAAVKNAIATKQALAVEKALTIVSEAGVTL